MRFVYFTHSLVSDWNHGNAHFLRGIVRELQRRGHTVRVHEPSGGWSRTNLRADAGEGVLEDFVRHFPDLASSSYRRGDLDLDDALDGADVAIAHEWSAPWLLAALGRRRAGGGRFVLLVHDTHHRAVSDPAAFEDLSLDAFDGVLAFGEALRDVYSSRGWGRRAWTWHEAADTSVFAPRPEGCLRSDLVWIGNWGDGERSRELRGYLLEPVRRLGLSALAHGVRYPASALAELRAAGIRYGGWLANAEVPDVFAHHRVTVHVPRRLYASRLPGIPTIRVFEALACGIPLVCAPWEDREGLFRQGQDYLVARDGEEMTRHLRAILSDPDLAASLAAHGLETIRRRHTCAHRVAELLDICRSLRASTGDDRRLSA